MEMKHQAFRRYVACRLKIKNLLEPSGQVSRCLTVNGLGV